MFTWVLLVWIGFILLFMLLVSASVALLMGSFTSAVFVRKVCVLDEVGGFIGHYNVDKRFDIA